MMGASPRMPGFTLQLFSGLAGAGLMLAGSLVVSQIDTVAFGRKLTAPLERAVPAVDLGPEQRIDGIIALGGNFVRFQMALDIAEQYPQAVILMSAGGYIESRAWRLVREHAIPEARVVMETRSETTFENARYAAEILRPRPTQRWVLVTDAWHMPRAAALFESAGFCVLPAPLFHPGENPTMHPLEIAVKEWGKLVYYRLMGRTDAIVPRGQAAYSCHGRDASRARDEVGT
jgi:uncharacterized SAM-binding protein YcdF (DUF218 family)